MVMPSEASTDTARFVRDLPVADAFPAALEDSGFIAIPEGWFIAATDVVRSREAIKAGRYKAVNMAGVAAISAVMNELDTRDIPFIFGGDGAILAVAPAERQIVADTLARLAVFVSEELDLELRAALVPVDALRANGFDIRVVAVRVSDQVSNFAFVGGGASEAERLMKQGEFLVPPGPAGSRPDLTGLSCRWTPVRAGNESIVSLIVEPAARAKPDEFSRIAGELLDRFGFAADAGNPMPAEGPGVAWPVSGMELEARAQRGTGSIWPVRVRLFLETLLAWFLFKTGISLGGFDPRRYRRYTGLNTDFRKVQDGLRMTLSLPRDELRRLEKYLEEIRAEGQIRYGICVQDTAVLTCYVPSITEDSHFHFLDGAGGGYAEAASAMRD